jgi:hypothetical protein
MARQPDQFRDLVTALVRQVEEWVNPHEWVTKTYQKKMRTPDRQIFEVPALFLQKGPIRVLLDPLAYDVPGTEGMVDLYLMPTYDDLASLSYVNEDWEIHYAFQNSGSDPPSVIESEALPLTKETINKVLDSIAIHAAPSV